MSRSGLKRKNTENVLATSESEPTNSSSANGNKVVKRGRPKKKQIEDVLLNVPDTNEKTDSVDLPASRTKNNVKENGIKNMEVEDSTNTKSKAENGTKSDEMNSVPNIKKRGRMKKNHTEVAVKVTEVDEKNVSEDLQMIVEENEVNVAPSLINDKNVAVEKSQSVLQNGTAFPDNISVIDVNEENKALKPNKRGRKKKLVENAAVENVEMVSSTPKTREIAVVKKIPVKRGRKNFKSTEVTASDNTESVKVATNENDDSDVSGDKNAEYKTENEVSEKRGRKKIVSFPKEENLSSTTENVSRAMEDEADGSSKKHNVPELLHEPSNQENCKEGEVLGTETEANVFFEDSAVDKEIDRKGAKTRNMKKCSVILERNEITENALHKLNSVSHKTKPDKAVNTKLAKNGDKGESSKGNNKREKDGSEDDFKPTKPSKVPKKATKSSEPKNIAKTPDIEMLDFSNKSINSSGEPWNFKISSWNINGVRAWLEKDGISYIKHEKPDIIALQETKCSDDKLPDEVTKIDGYHCYWVAGDKEGYSGVGLLSKQEPIEVKYGIGADLHDNEGRVITAEYEKFFVVAAYVPNAGRGLIRLEYRTEWDKDFRSYLKKLDEKKPVILCGDLNVAHEEVDLANPKNNKKNAGFTKEEREGFSTLLEEGFLDTFRHLYPDAKGAYTFWTYMMNARAKNVGWRLDYFVISERFADSLCDSVIRKEIYGSDHCPITLFLAQ